MTDERQAFWRGVAVGLVAEFLVMTWLGHRMLNKMQEETTTALDDAWSAVFENGSNN